MVTECNRNNRVGADRVNGDLLLDAATGDVRLVSCTSVPDTLAQLEADSCAASLQHRIAICMWEELPDLPAILADVQERLAATALQLWPHWYGVELDPTLDATTSGWRSAIERAVLAKGISVSQFLPAWLKAAAHLCRAGQPPLPAGYSHASQLTQLALTIAPTEIVFVLCVASPTASRNTLFGLAKAAEWLAAGSGASVRVLVSNELAGASELDSISYRSMQLDAELPVVKERLEVEEKTSFVVLPVQGRPHPNSPGEQLLARSLHNDARLRGLFAPNQIIETVRHHHLMVDLVWQEGKLVVEVDGYQWHSSKEAFSRDRQRDYELSISSYLTLRLPHHELVADPDLAIEKIADMVALRRHALSLHCL